VSPYSAKGKYISPSPAGIMAVERVIV